MMGITKHFQRMGLNAKIFIPPSITPFVPSTKVLLWALPFITTHLTCILRSSPGWQCSGNVAKNWRKGIPLLKTSKLPRKFGNFGIFRSARRFGWPFELRLATTHAASERHIMIPRFTGLVLLPSRCLSA